MTSPTRRDPIGFSNRPKTRGASPYKTNREALVANAQQIAKIRKMSRRALTRQVVGPFKKYRDESSLTDKQRAIHRAKVEIWLEGCTPSLTAPSSQRLYKNGDEETLSANKKS